MSNLTMELPSNLEQLAPFRATLTEWLTNHGVDEERTEEMVLAVDEALTNICEHGYGDNEGTIEVQLEDYPDRAEVLLRDHAPAFNPTLVPPQKLPPERVGGVGVTFIRTNTDRLEYTVGRDKANELHLVKMKAHKND